MMCGKMARTAAALAFILGPALASGGAAMESAPRGAQGNGVKRRTEVASDCFTHLGCFKDVKDDRVMKLKREDELMTPEMCYNDCVKIGSAYFATQFGTECWCTADALEDYSRHGVGVCNYWCGGDSNQTCGGRDAFDVYSLDKPAPPGGPDYIGCFQDNPLDRVFKSRVTDVDDMTSEECVVHCGLDGKASGYYATQYGYECWCGIASSSGEYSRHGEGSCTIPCAGDMSVSCGGYNAFDLFYYDYEEVEPNASPSVDDDDTAVEDDMMLELMDFHNAVRCVHEADPLVYDVAMADIANDEAIGMVTETTCGSFDDAKNTGLGVNMYVCSNDDPSRGCFDPAEAMSEFYGMQVGGGPPSNWGVHARQILWKHTTKMGCGMQACEKAGMYYNYLVCLYELPADTILGDIGENVDYQRKTFQECGYASN